MRIIGIDPGSLHCGVAIIDDDGHKLHLRMAKTLHFPARANLSLRLLELAEKLDEIFKIWQPQELALEKIFFHKSFSATLVLGEARGVIIVCAAQNKCQLFEYAPNLVKNTVVGQGKASKEQVQMMMQHLFSLPPQEAFDTTDALALAFTHAQMLQRRKLGVLPTQTMPKQHSSKKNRQAWADFVNRSGI